MTHTIKVKPLRDDLPPHPVGGALPKAGGRWPADQFTFRRMRDGDIEEVADDNPSDDKPSADAPAEPPKPSNQRGRSRG